MQYTDTDPNIPIIYEDDQLLVIDKPHKLLSQPDHTDDPDVTTLCKHYLNTQTKHTGHSYLGLLHRLDRPVGGLMILAKTKNAANDLSRQIRDRTVRKTYWAVVSGITPANGFLSHYLQKRNTHNVVDVVPGDASEAKEAILSYRKISERDQLSLLAVYLQTGRPHQIRVQLAHEEFPIWGDYKYGPSSQPGGRSMGLRSIQIAFDHPKTGREMEFRLRPPEQEPWTLFDHAIQAQFQ
jgi:23S rRNA pseudouridine1911/1915/1917 synthase